VTSDSESDLQVKQSLDRRDSLLGFQNFLGVQLTATELASISPVSLAYVGDAVFELYVRSRFLLPAKRVRDYHQQVVCHVKTEQQAHYVDQLTPFLTDAEKDLLRRGRNATSGRNRRANAQDYQKATSFEALVGYLYLSDQPRLFELLTQLDIGSS